MASRDHHQSRLSRSKPVSQPTMEPTTDLEAIRQDLAEIKLELAENNRKMNQIIQGVYDLKNDLPPTNCDLDIRDTLSEILSLLRSKYASKPLSTSSRQSGSY